jgi:signal transduction histidine kinase
MSNSIFLFVITSVVMILLFASFFKVLILSQQKKINYQKGLQQLREKQHSQLIESAVRSEEEERLRIAEQLHDEIGAILSAAKLHVVGIKSSSLPPNEAKLHGTAKELLDEAIQKVRSISHNLHSSILTNFGLNEAIRHFIQSTTGNIINIHINLDESYSVKDAEGDISTLRLVQELVQNILKHASPKYLNISSKFVDNQLSFQINHDGQGLSQQDFEELRYKTHGLGLRNIQNRLILLKGAILFQKNETSFTIFLTIPKNKL